MKKKQPAKGDAIVLSGICKLIPEHLVSKLARQYGIDQQARTFSPWSHVVSLLYAQLTHAVGLNDVCDGLAHHATNLPPFTAQRLPPKSKLLEINLDKAVGRTMPRLDKFDRQNQKLPSRCRCCVAFFLLCKRLTRHFSLISQPAVRPPDLPAAFTQECKFLAICERCHGAQETDAPEAGSANHHQPKKTQYDETIFNFDTTSDRRPIGLPCQYVARRQGF